MQIDWLTVIAQIVNFLILIWLLQRFLYRPVIEAMERREQRIAGRLQEARQREQAAGEKVQEYEARRLELEQTRQQRLNETEEAAEEKRKALLEKAREETANKHRQWQAQVEQEQQHFLKELRNYSIEAIQQIGRRTLADLANSDLETQIIQVFLQRLKSMDNATRKTLHHTQGPIIVNSAFDLDAGTKGRITSAIHEQIDESVEVEYGQSTDLLCGIELKAGGHQIGWTLADHLDHLNELMEKAFKN